MWHTVQMFVDWKHPYAFQWAIYLSFQDYKQIDDNIMIDKKCLNIIWSVFCMLQPIIPCLSLWDVYFCHDTVLQLIVHMVNAMLLLGFRKS